jgi:signal transduction histidine kinase
VLRLSGFSMLPLFLTPWAFTMIVAVEAGIVTTRLLRAWSGLIALNRELESRVAAKHAELEQTYARVRDLEHERIVAEERQRITRDIHDGLGGHLVTTLAMLESADEFSRDDVAEALRGALDDLRLVIDSLDPRETDLVGVLATVRSRLEPRLRRRGLAFRWDVADLPPAPDFGPERLLRVMRVVQEAITNVLKHARATTITVRTGVDGGRGFVSVGDDGCGFEPEHAEGRGLVNMRRRAGEIGGELEIRTGEGGTTVTLWLASAA